jgi:hypothetical protein
MSSRIPSIQAKLTSVFNNDPAANLSLQAGINYLRVRITSNLPITASEMNILFNTWNVINNHTHTIIDTVGVKTYGNTNPSGYSTTPGTQLTKVTEPSTNFAGPVNAVTTSSIILAAKHNEIRSKLTGSLNHTHSWVDQAS